MYSKISFLPSILAQEKQGGNAIFVRSYTQKPLWNLQGQDGWSSEQPGLEEGLEEGVPAQAEGLEQYGL